MRVEPVIDQFQFPNMAIDLFRFPIREPVFLPPGTGPLQTCSHGKMVAGYCWRAPGEGELATYAGA